MIIINNGLSKNYKFHFFLNIYPFIIEFLIIMLNLYKFIRRSKQGFFAKNKSFKVTDVKIHNDNIKYGACEYIINNRYRIFYRNAKKTPTKNGYFTTLWMRDDNDYAIPYDHKTIGEYLIVNVIDGKHEGQYIFPKKILIQQKIISYNDNIGKMAFRVYPPWTKTFNKQAHTTQKWQNLYFFNFI